MLYPALKTLHILLAIVALGYNLTYGFWLTWAHKQDRAILLFVLEGVRKIDRIANWAYTLLLVTGLGIAHAAHFPLQSLWIWLSVAILFVALGLGHGLYTPTLKKQIAMLKEKGEGSPEYLALSGRGNAVGLALSVAAIAIVGLMVWKPT